MWDMKPVRRVRFFFFVLFCFVFFFFSHIELREHYKELLHFSYFEAIT
jgi:hypothetical protein